jgi:hypothetical protein
MATLLRRLCTPYLRTGECDDKHCCCKNEESSMLGYDDYDTGRQRWCDPRRYLRKRKPHHLYR